MAAIPDHKQERAAIILAGGEGTRLRELTRRILGHCTPKQFCPVVGKSTLLEQTRKRVALTFAPERTATVVTKAHEHFYGPLVADIPRERLVIQPENRGTASAILYSLLRLAETAPNAVVAIFPSDHYVDNDAEFMRHVELAFAAVEARPELTVLLGIAPDGPESGYGWIEPTQPVPFTDAPVLRVGRFWEKPAAHVARELMARGCLWNSFVMVARVSTLLGLFIIAKPRLYFSFSAIRPTLGTVFEEATLRTLYANLASSDFSAEILALFPINLAVLPVSGVQWSDLGEPRRVIDTLARAGLRPRWAVA